ncbi:hypothetical protein, partial [Desulfosporosinus sp.]|uniref:hypothetical protein n=1 Tax=Desulfosporosinus sp. TaxID=157907 RepID=UPI0026342A38
ESSPRRYFSIAAIFSSSDIFALWDIKKLLLVINSFIILTVYHKGSIPLFVRKAHVFISQFTVIIFIKELIHEKI